MAVFWDLAQKQALHTTQLGEPQWAVGFTSMVAAFGMKAPAI